MASEILAVLIRINLAAAAAILLVLLLRQPVRRIAGPLVAYALWLAVPVAAIASLAPPRKVVTFVPQAASQPITAVGDSDGFAGIEAFEAPASLLSAIDWMAAGVAVWLIVALGAVAWLAWRQHRFLRHVGKTERRGARIHALRSDVGPAVVGVLKPRILVPADFDARFSPREQDVVLAHETFHLKQGHAQTNAAVLLAQCLNWFNPLIHVAGRLLRLDQELACDAAVVARYPKARRSYAEAMLKTQLAPTALPLGCYWPAKGASALKQRLAMLQVAPPPPWRMGAGVMAALSLSAAAGVAAWAAQPPKIVHVAAPPAARAAPKAPATAKVQLAQNAPETSLAVMADLPAAEVAKVQVEALAIADSATAGGFVEQARTELTEELNQARQDLEAVRRSGAGDEEVQDALMEVRYMEAALESFGRAANPKRRAIAPRPPRDVVSVMPGHTVMVETSTVTPDGRAIGGEGVFTAGDSNIGGSYTGDAHYSLISDIRQIGDQVELTPKFYLDGKLIGTTVVRLHSGETRDVPLSNGQVIRAAVKIKQLRTAKALDGRTYASAYATAAAYSALGDVTTRTLPWTGQELAVNLSADVVYRRGSAASVAITGPQEAVDRVVVDDGAIRFQRDSMQRFERMPRLKIVVTAPAVTEFRASGSQVLTIQDYAADDIDIHVSGSATVRVSGRTRVADMLLSGSGRIDLSALRIGEGDFRVSGSGSILAGTVEDASAVVSGSGVIRFNAQPRALSQRVFGSGRIILPDRAAKSPPRTS